MRGKIFWKKRKFTTAFFLSICFAALLLYSSYPCNNGWVVYGRGYRQIFLVLQQSEYLVQQPWLAHIGTVFVYSYYTTRTRRVTLDNRYCLKPGYIFLKSSFHLTLIVTHGQRSSLTSSQDTLDFIVTFTVTPFSPN